MCLLKEASLACEASTLALVLLSLSPEFMVLFWGRRVGLFSLCFDVIVVAAAGDEWFRFLSCGSSVVVGLVLVYVCSWFGAHDGVHEGTTSPHRPGARSDPSIPKCSRCQVSSRSVWHVDKTH